MSSGCLRYKTRHYLKIRNAGQGQETKRSHLELQTGSMEKWRVEGGQKPSKPMMSFLQQGCTSPQASPDSATNRGQMLKYMSLCIQMSLCVCGGGGSHSKILLRNKSFKKHGLRHNSRILPKIAIAQYSILRTNFTTCEWGTSGCCC